MFLFFIIVLCSLKNYGQEFTEIDIHSTQLNEIKVIRVFLPENYKENKKRRYPLTVVIDAESLFDSYVASARLLSKNELAPQQIVVGITHFESSNKSRDYGYNILNSFPHDNSMNTLNFIKGELIPMLKDKYRIASFKTVVGDDITANFTNYFLFDKSPAFGGYISINPEFAPDMPAYMKQYTSEIKGDDTFYYMANGNNLGEKKLKLTNDVDISLVGVSNVYFNYKYDAFKNTNKVVCIPQALAKGQEYVFSMYSPITDEEFEKNISYLSPMAAMEYLQYKYENIEYLFGEKVPIRQVDFVKLEHIVLDYEEGSQLEAYGNLALEVHPKSPLGNYYIGQFYEKTKEYDKALLAYKRGYSKIPESSPKSYGYYMNIKRIIALQKLEQEALNAPVEATNEEEIIEDTPSEENLDSDTTDNNETEE